MSLDVCLNGEAKYGPCQCECGHEHICKKSECLYTSNITHNLGYMAEEAGIYKHLWRPEEIEITKASQLIEPLRAGLALMKSDPARFKKHNASNGWGLYEHFVPWVTEYLAACESWPNSTVEVSR